MKRLLFLIVALIMATGVMGANQGTEYVPPFTDDSIYIDTTVYTPIGSLAVTLDTAGHNLYFISGTMELGVYSWVHLFFGSDTTAAGVPELVSYNADSTSNDTTVCTLHEYYWRENRGRSPMRIPFSFQQNMAADSIAGPITLYFYGKAQDLYHPVILHDVRIEALSNLSE